MADTPDNSWVPVDGGAKDAQGNYMALQGGQWKPAKGVAKDASGKYVAHFGDTAAPSSGGGADVPNMDSDVAAFKKGNKEYHDKLDSESTLTKIKGAADAVGSTVWNMGAGVVGDIAGAAKGLTSKKYGTQAGVQEAMDRADEVTRKLGVMPGSEAGKVYSEAIGKVLSASGLEGAMGAEAGVASRAGGKVATEAAEGAKASLSAAAQKAATLSKIDPVVLKQATKAQELGIPVNIHQLYQNKLGRMVGETLQEVPFGGSIAKTQRAAFDKLLVKQLGGDGERLTPDVFSKAMDKSGSEIGEHYQDKSIPLTQEFTAALDKHKVDAVRYGEGDTKTNLPNYVEDVERIAKENNGIIPGASLRRLDSDIGRAARKTVNSDLKDALYDLQDTLRDQLVKQMQDPKEAAALKDARMRYAKGKTLEPLVAKSADGSISPALLMGRVTSSAEGKSAMARGSAGEMGDLSRIGQLFLKAEKSSGTAERNVAMKLIGIGGAGGAGAATHPVATAATAATAVTASRLYNTLGPKLAERVIKAQNKRAAEASAAEMARKLRREQKLKAMAEDAS